MQDNLHAYCVDDACVSSNSKVSKPMCTAIVSKQSGHVFDETFMYRSTEHAYRFRARWNRARGRAAGGAVRGAAGNCPRGCSGRSSVYSLQQNCLFRMIFITRSSKCARCVWPKSCLARQACSEPLCMGYTCLCIVVFLVFWLTTLASVR